MISSSYILFHPSSIIFYLVFVKKIWKKRSFLRVQNCLCSVVSSGRYQWLTWFSYVRIILWMMLNLQEITNFIILINDRPDSLMLLHVFDCLFGFDHSTPSQPAAIRTTNLNALNRCNPCNAVLSAMVQ